MSELLQAVDEYLALRRALGYTLYETGLVLHQFVRFAEGEGADFITTELALRWATQSTRAQPTQWAKRLTMLRGFARYRRASDPRTEVPPAELLPQQVRRPAPYIYTDGEVMRLMQAAERLPSATGLRRHTYATLFGLLAVTGMRISEPLGLDHDDVDLAHGILTIRRTKFGKTRWIPIHPSTQQALQRYALQRNRRCPHPQSPSFFISERGGRLTAYIVRHTFVKLSRQIGLRGPTDSHGPRLHDLRHRFAVNTLLQWHRSGIDVERHLPRLSTYLGHAHVADTYWYLTATPELLQIAASRRTLEV